MPALLVTVPPEGACHVAFRGTGALSRLLIGRSVDEVPDMAASLYAICSRAQSGAARLALRGTIREADRLAVAGEIMREHVLRIQLGWAELSGDAPEVESAMRVNGLTRSADRLPEAARIASDAIFNVPAKEWLGLDTQGISDWAFRGQTLAARHIAATITMRALPPCPDRAPLALRHADHAPLAEAGAGTLLEFHLARLVDLARICIDPAAVMAEAPEYGVGRIACSRGTLEHVAEIEDGIVSDYRIHAPTDRQFAAGGSARAWLDLLPAMESEKRLSAARQMLHALDPCVEFRCTDAPMEQA